MNEPTNLPIKPNFKTEVFPVLIIIASVLFGFYFFSHFPDQVITHWNFKGTPDGHSGRFFGAFALPIVLLFIYALFLIIPAIDPHKDRYESFQKPYRVIRNAVMFVLLGVFIASGEFNLGHKIAINYAIPLLVGVLMLFIGSQLGQIKKNWFVGIKTPWTLSSETVWDKTHKLGAKAFIIFGVILIVCPFLNFTLALIALIAGALLVIVGLPVYSYILYKEEQKQLIKL